MEYVKFISMFSKGKECTMKKRLIVTAALIALVMPFISMAGSVNCTVDEYKLTMYVYVPRIYDNNLSLGYRKYQRQRVTGILQIAYPNDGGRPTILIEELVNQTHKLSTGIKVAYKCRVDQNVMYPRVNLIGNNKTDKFNTAAINFYLDAEPNYNKGEDNEDNSLLITLGGKGLTKAANGGRRIYYISGNLAGTLGCGCYAYGHTSPTRVAGWRHHLNIVDDVAAVWGSWIARYSSSYCATLETDD